MLADLIDAAWVGSDVAGNTGSGNYTTAGWVAGVGKGLTVAPAGGDTGKTLFFANAGMRYTTGEHAVYSERGYSWSAPQYNTTVGWRLRFYYEFTSGMMNAVEKLNAISLRCVRS